MTESKTAAQYREAAAAHDAEAAASFDRCDTDGYASQAASGLMGSLNRAKAAIAEAGGRAEFPALFTTAGDLVAAKLVETRFGMAWGLLADDDPHGRFTGWFRPSAAATAAKRQATDARKGYQVGRVMAPANADFGGGGTGFAGMSSVRVYNFRTVGGFSRDVEVVSPAHYRDIVVGPPVT
jgi:hypothetical protein